MNTLDAGYIPASEILKKLDISEEKFRKRFESISLDVE